MVSTVVELVGFAVLAGTAFSWNHTVGGVVAGGELLLIGYALDGTRLDLREQMTRLQARRARRTVERHTKWAAKKSR